MVNWQSGWSRWAPISSANISEIPTRPGAYVIATNRELTRAVGTDKEGIIDIGESLNLKTRLQSFWRCAQALLEGERPKWGHMAGVRYRQLGFHQIFPLETLRFRWLVVPDKEGARRQEALKMAEYFLDHWELPPLNYSLNREFYDCLWDLKHVDTPLV